MTWQYGDRRGLVTPELQGSNDAQGPTDMKKDFDQVDAQHCNFKNRSFIDLYVQKVSIESKFKKHL